MTEEQKFQKWVHDMEARMGNKFTSLELALIREGWMARAELEQK